MTAKSKPLSKPQINALRDIASQGANGASYIFGRGMKVSLLNRGLIKPVTHENGMLPTYILTPEGQTALDAVMGRPQAPTPEAVALLLQETLQEALRRASKYHREMGVFRYTHETGTMRYRIFPYPSGEWHKVMKTGEKVTYLGRAASRPYTYDSRNPLPFWYESHFKDEYKALPLVKAYEESFASVRVIDEDTPAITVHLNAAPDLSPETAAALEGLVKIAIDAMENDSVIDDIDDDEPSFESLIDMSKWTETRAILTRDPETGTITVQPDTPALDEAPVLQANVTYWFRPAPDGSLSGSITVDPQPLTDEQQGLLELAESLADGLESGDIILVDDTDGDDIEAQRDHDERMNAVMMLTLEEAAMMEKVCRHDGLVIWRHNEIGMQMAKRLEEGGLVTIDRKHPGYVIVSAVRPDEEGEED